MEIPATVTALNNSFKDCPNLYKVTFLGNTVPTGIADAFSAVVGRQTYVSTAAYESYASVLGTVNVYSNLSSMFEVGGVVYIPIPDSRTAVAYDCDYTTAAIEVPSTVRYKNVGLSVSSIMSQTFRGNTQMTSLRIGGTVPSVGGNALTGCSALRSLTLDEGAPALAFNASLSELPLNTLSVGRDVQYTTSPFTGLSNLMTLYVLGNAKGIRAGEFSGCTALTTLGTAGDVATIEARAFKDVTTLSDISLDGTDMVIGTSAFERCTGINNLTLEGGVATIGEKAFYGCSGMRKLVTNSGLSTICASAFEGCTQLANVTLASTISSFGSRAFFGCSAIQSPLRISNTQATTVGNFAFYECSMVPSITLGNGVTTLGTSAFKGCSAATTVSFGNNIRSIGDYAFSGCSSLGAADLKNRVEKLGTGAFKNCTSLASVTLPASITSIGARAFMGCTSLPTAALPAAVTAIAPETFSGCSALASVSVSPQLASIGDSAFLNTSALSTFDFPAPVTTIGAHAFDGSAITSAALPAGVTAIADGAFARTSALETIDLSHVASIGDGAFAGSALPALTIPSTVLTIGQGAFDDCTALAELTIASGSKKLILGINATGEGLFHDCGLASLYLGRELQYGTSAEQGYTPFYGNPTLRSVSIGEKAISVPENMFRGCTGLEDVTLAPTVTAMGSAAFRGSGVKTINFPSKLSYIPAYAFADCPRLATLDVPATISRIDQHAFDGSGLQTISLPSTVATIDEYVLANTHSLRSVAIAEGTEVISTNAFSGSYLPAITIPNTVTNIANGAFTSCSRLASLTIADGSEQLSIGYNSSGQGMFYDCPLTTLYQGRDLKYSTSSLYGTSPFYASATLASVEIGDLPTKVESKQFYNCAALTSVKIGDSVTTIGDFAFSGCSALDTFEVGASIQDIGSDAFSDCTGMLELRTYATIPPYCGDQALSDIDKFSCTLFVPNGSETDYAAAEQWNEFFFVEGFDAGIKASYIELSTSASTLNVGETLQLTATVYPESALLRSVDWTTSNPAIADVNAQGIVTAYAEGEAIITATAKDGSNVTAQCVITVFNPDKPIEYALTLENISIGGTNIVNLPVRMTNKLPAITFICDIALPDGLEIVKDENGIYAFTKGDRMTTQLLAPSDVNGKVRVLSYSMTNTPYAESDGVLFYIPLRLTNPDMAIGTEMTISLSDVLISTTDFDEHTAPDVSATVTVEKAYTPGDVNSDGRITPVDIALTVSKVLGGSPANFNFAAADMNQDGRITPVDIARIVSIILGGSNAPAFSGNDFNIEQSGEVASISLHGDGSMSIALSGIDRFTAMQMDVELPAGVALDNANLSEPSNHAVHFSRLDNGSYRILIYSLANDNIPAGAQISLSLSGQGRGNVAVDNILVTEDCGADEFNEYAVERCSVSTSGALLGYSDGLKVVPDANGLTVISSCDTTITLSDILGRSRTYAIHAGTNSISLETGVYMLGTQKIIIR